MTFRLRGVWLLKFKFGWFIAWWSVEFAEGFLQHLGPLIQIVVFGPIFSHCLAHHPLLVALARGLTPLLEL